MRFAIALLVALALVTSAACGGGDDAEPAAPLAQRVVTAEDAPGSKADPVEKRQMTADFEEFIDVLAERAIDPDTEEMSDVFTEAGFEAAILDTRFFGETHNRNSLTSFHRSFSFSPNKARRMRSSGSTPTA